MGVIVVGHQRQVGDFRRDRNPLAMDLYLARALEHRAPAGSRCLEAGEDNGVLAVGRERLEVMKHTSAGRHATRRNDDLGVRARRSEEHTSELQSLMRISYAVFCLKKK